MRYLNYIFFALVTIAICYGAGRLYFRLTGGFTEGNITNNSLTYDPRWDVRPLDTMEQHQVDSALAQEYHYLGKGCQSYVFISDDGKTVIKFPKYQRFRPQEWINLFTWIPSVAQYQERKTQERRHQMEKVFRGWTLGFNELAPETGVLFVHLNKTPNWSRHVVLHDKLGVTHEIDLGQKEFLLQRRAVMLEDTLRDLMAHGNIAQAKGLLDSLVAMIMGEYSRGLADNDHALLQNTGVIDGRPIHIDVGQFVRHNAVKDPQLWQKELFNKTFRLHEWLQKRYPVLADHLKALVIARIGQAYYTLPPYVYRPNFDKLPDDSQG